jgi:hypothetical protein
MTEKSSECRVDKISIESVRGEFSFVISDAGLDTNFVVLSICRAAKQASQKQEEDWSSRKIHEGKPVLGD